MNSTGMFVRQMQLTRHVHPQNQGMKVVDIDVGQTPRREAEDARWSITRLGVPVSKVAAMMLTYGLALLWIDNRLAPIPILVEQNKEIRDSIYRQDLAKKDLEIRDDRIAELTRRVGVLECAQEGRKRCS
jgi:hypothetical protein